jgi:signal transduction histidine kinase
MSASNHDSAADPGRHHALELARLEAEIQKVLDDQRALWDRMATLTHKINNPLTSLIGRAQLLANRHREDEYVRHAAEVIEESSRRIADYVGEIAQMVREQRGETRRPVAAEEPASSSTRTGV